MIHQPSARTLSEADSVNIAWKLTTAPTEPFWPSWQGQQLVATARLLLLEGSMLPSLWRKQHAEKPSRNTKASLSVYFPLETYSTVSFTRKTSPTSCLAPVSSRRPQSAITHVGQTQHHLLPQHKSTAVPCDRQGLVCGPGQWKGVSADRQRQARRPLPSCGNHTTTGHEPPAAEPRAAAGTTADSVAVLSSCDSGSSVTAPDVPTP